MSKHRKGHEEHDYNGEADQILNADIDLDDDAFFEQFQPRQTRRKSKHSRNARRRIEELKEERELAKRLDEYYHLDIG